MNLRILCVGRRARDPLLDAAEDYLARLKRHARVELLRVRDGSPTDERDRLLAKLPSSPPIIALDEAGRSLDTMEVARRLDAWRQQGRDASFVIGGASGLAPEVRERATETWSLSAMTLPHRLALVILCEQLYRAHTILRGEKYHRA